MRKRLLCGLALLLWVSTAQADILTGLVGCWNFDEGTGGAGSTTADMSGRGNTGTLGSGSANPAWTTGIVGPFALQFTGSETDSVNVGNGASLNPTAAVTIAGRVNVTSATTTQILVWKGIVDTSEQYMVAWRSTQRVRCTLGIAGSAVAVTSNTNLNAATNYSFTCVYNGTDVRTYVNGSLDSTPVGATGSLTASGTSMLFGTSANTAPQATTGVLDDLRIWSRALSATDVAEYHANTVPCGRRTRAVVY